MRTWESEKETLAAANKLERSIECCVCYGFGGGASERCCVVESAIENGKRRGYIQVLFYHSLISFSPFLFEFMLNFKALKI